VTHDHPDGSYGVDIFGSRLLDLWIALRHERHQALAFASGIYDLYGGLACDEQREDHPGENDDVTHWKERKDMGNREELDRALPVHKSPP
jgi:hypothetical protein